MYLVINENLIIRLDRYNTNTFIDKHGLNPYTLAQCFRVYEQYETVDGDLAITFATKNGTLRLAKRIAGLAHRAEIRYDITFYEMWK